MTVETFALVGLGSGLMLALAVAGGAVLGWANRKFHVPVDPRVERVNAVLPAANCGDCGFIGCMDYAEAVVAGRAVPTLCAARRPGGGQRRRRRARRRRRRDLALSRRRALHRRPRRCGSAAPSTAASRPAAPPTW